ncbi:putative tail fiber [Klebsiella phage vB_KpnS_15-38_KLPPOU149]|uniref:Putative tail fiber n=1 Tax=Klebsiella phage vB_KpnS_15-38_KLPPOU149 TaxID=2686209 RepID=A0A6B9J0F3_9CAUD|nr:tail fiber protein [Klebsiella phage vB_KpnS_15-38_KLPPOU149]QGZ13440.1 putative tail fiber [Klebsiella phage vB_KpnS_15-38_KLPPOU149]
MALYREGKAAMAADGTVTGTGTKWQSSLSLIRPGATIVFLSSPIQMAVVNKVVSDTEIKAITTKGAVVASSDYAILLSDSLTVDGLAQDVAETLRYYQSQETVIADAVEFFKTFDFESLQNLANQVKADSQSAGASATAAAASESAAKTSETNAKASENKAKTSETNAKASETAAKTSETNAKASETAAKTSETNAKSSENKAKTSETNAKASETAAKTSETNAKASETAAKTSETNAKASETAAKTSETNAKASETAANSAKTDAQTAKGQTQNLRDQVVDLVAGVQAPDKLPGCGNGRYWMKIANIKRVSSYYCFLQFIVGGGSDQGNVNLPVDIFSLSGRGLPSSLTSDNIDTWFTQRSLVAAKSSTSRIKLGVVQYEDGSFDVYFYAPSGYIPQMWLNRLNVQANNGSITGPIIDRTGYSWITTEPSGIVYNSPSDYLMANDSTIPRTNVANTFSQPQAISVPGGNATLTLNGCTVRANNNNALVLSTPSGSEGMSFRPNGDTSVNGQMTISGNGDVLVNGVVKSKGVDVTASQNLPLKETTATTGIGVNFIGDNATECSFGIENTAGGSAVFHNYTRGASNSVTKNNQLLGGYGSRPWLGSAYTAHSNAAMHFLGAGDASASNHGGWLRLLVTPKGKTISDRVPAFRLSDNGDVWMVSAGAMHPDFDAVRSYETLNAALPKFNAPTNQDGRGLKIVSADGAPEINMIAPRGSDTSSPAVRAMWCDGSLGNSAKYIGATQQWSNFFFGASGHDGEKFDSMRGAVNIQAPGGWGATSTPTRILFETCATGSTTRTSRWCVDHNGNFIPMGDGGYDIGWGSGRVNNIYAKNGAINTSDGRMKNDVRAMSDPETEAAKAIAKEIGFWTWKEQANMNDVREHCGLTVQRAMEIMESFGLEPFKYGFICYDKWDEQTVVSEYGPANEDGSENPIYKTIPAGDRYSFRVDELNMFIAKGFEARLSALEDKLGM